MTMTITVEGTLQTGTGWYIQSVTGERYKIHISDIEKMEEFEVYGDGCQVTAEVAIDIYPPSSAKGWIKHGSVQVKSVEGDSGEAHC